MQKIRKEFLLIESMTALWLAVLIISTLTLTVFVQYQQLKQLETRVTAHKLIWERLRDDSAPTKTTFSNHTYQTIADKNSVKVIGDAGKTYQVTWR